MRFVVGLKGTAEATFEVEVDDSEILEYLEDNGLDDSPEERSSAARELAEEKGYDLRPRRCTINCGGDWEVGDYFETAYVEEKE